MPGLLILIIFIFGCNVEEDGVYSSRIEPTYPFYLLIYFFLLPTIAENMTESFVRLLEVVAKYSWGILVVCLFVLFLPDKQAETIRIGNLKEQFLGYWWILLVFSGTVCVGSLFSKVMEWRVKRRSEAEAERQKAERREKIIRRLYSLDMEERMWLKYCLFKNVQTLLAAEIHPTANSLLSKEIITVGSGSIMSLPFTIQDFVWEYLLAHRGEFLPQIFENDIRAGKVLADFEEGLRKIY